MSRCELVKEERRKEKEVKQSWDTERKDAGSKSNSALLRRRWNATTMQHALGNPSRSTV